MTPSTLLDHARTWLFVPGNRPDRFAKAHDAGADIVIVDLEDAVAADAKIEARAHSEDWLSRGGSAVVRINAPGSVWFDEDLEMARSLSVPVIVPKSEDPALLADIASRGIPTVALIESALGIENAFEIARTPGVSRVGLGHVDLALELGVDPNQRVAFSFARARLVLASAAASIAAPIDGVTTNINDMHVLADDVRHARAIGFTAKFCIHPRQINETHAAFAPTAQEVAWARRLLSQSQSQSQSNANAIEVDGQMVDKPVLARAQRLLTLASQHNL